MNKNTKLLFAHKLLYDVYFYGAITIPFFVSKGYGLSVALTFASAFMVTSMIMEVPTGIVGDRYGHRLSLFLSAFLTGCSLFALLLMNNIVWDTAWIMLLATSSAFASGSDVALLRFVSNNFERDNRTFDYLKSVMLLLSFGAAGFVAKYLSLNIAVGLSGALGFACIPPLILIRLSDHPERKMRKIASINKQIADLPRAVHKVNGGLALIILAGLVGAVTFSAKEIISSFNTVYEIDISLIGIIAALAMAGRIVGTAIEKRLRAGYRILLLILTIVVGMTAFIEVNRVIGVAFMLLSTVVARMLFYRLKYRLASEAPQSHVASLVSGMGLVGTLSSGGIILLTGVIAGLGYFYLSFVAVAAVIALLGGPLAARLAHASIKP